MRKLLGLLILAMFFIRCSDDDGDAQPTNNNNSGGGNGGGGGQTEQLSFRLFFDGFYVAGDCDQGILDNTGEGEFSYDLVVKVNGTEVKDLSRTADFALADTDEWIYLNESVTVDVPDESGSTFSIEVTVTEDDGSEVETLGSRTATFSYPFDASDFVNGTTAGEPAYVMPLRKSDDCEARLSVQITEQ